MAKEEPKSTSAPNTGDTLGILLGIFVLFIIVQQIYVRIRAVFVSGGEGTVAQGFVEGIIDFTFWLKIFAVIIASILLAGIVRVRAKLIKQGAIERSFYFPNGISETKDIDKKVSTRWDTVVSHADSDNPNDWKVAILEADIILDDLLDHLGYTGDSMGEKLKQIEKSDFLTLDKAWEAHKVRNAIAHEGGQFLINHREVLRILELYKDVFDEFYYV